MWLKKTRDHPHLIYFLLISACLNLLLMPLALWNFGDLKENIFNEEIVASIVTSREDEEFIREVCKDLGIENEITMLVGPYYVHSFFSQTQNYRLNTLLSKYPIIVDPEDPAGRILMKESIYKELTSEERRAVLSHELWHIYAFIRDGRLSMLNLNKEFEANRFAIKYVSPGVLINLYRRYGGDHPEVNAIIEDLESQLTVSEKPTDHHYDLIKTMSRDLRLKKNVELILLPGPPLPSGDWVESEHSYYLITGEDFFFGLPETEQRALIAHEMGHAVFLPPVCSDPIHCQVGADLIAAGYVLPKVLIDLLSKLSSETHWMESYEYKTRLEHLKLLLPEN